MSQVSDSVDVSSSKEKLITHSQNQSSTSIKSKSSKGILSALFTKSKSKREDNSLETSASITCLYTSSNLSQDRTCSNMSNGDSSISNNTITKTSVSQPNITETAKTDSKQTNSTEKNVNLSIEEKDKLTLTLTTKKTKKPTIFNKFKKKSGDQTETQVTPSTKTESSAKGCCSLTQYSTLSSLSPDNISTCAALKEILDFGTRLQDSEHHLLQIFAKYLKDEQLEKELIDIVFGHAILHIEAERRAQALASEMWRQQTDIYQSQEKTLAENLKDMVRQNRKLQEENELLIRRMERMYSRTSLTTNDSTEGNEDIVDRLNKSNERLRTKIGNLMHQMNDLDSHLLYERERSTCFEGQVRTSFAEIQNQKASIQNIKNDYELELARVRHQLNSKDDIINDSIKCSDTVLEEIEKVKRDLPQIFTSVNWEKAKTSGNVLLNVLVISKLCIAELAEDIAQAQNELQSTQVERDTFKQETMRLKCVQETTSNEITSLMKTTEELNENFHQSEEYMRKILELEKAVEKLDTTMHTKDQLLEEERNQKVMLMQGIQQLKDMVNLKEDEIRSIKMENESFKYQVTCLNQVLMQSGAGDVARELACTQEKLHFMQSDFFQMNGIKSELEEKLTTCLNELEAFQISNNALNEKLQLQTEEIRDLVENKMKIREEMATQQATLIALQNERRRHLAEKTFLKVVYDQIKDQASKTDALEGSLSMVNQEATRLAVIADYNKQLGERYQTELMEKDAIINELKENINQLSDMQKTNVREKAALCEELTEVCTMKDLLNNKLAAEVQRGQFVDESSKALDSAIAKEITAIKEMQVVERQAAKDLLQNFNALNQEREGLLKEKAESAQQLERLTNEVRYYREEADKAGKGLIDTQNIIYRLETQLSTAEENAKYLTEKIHNSLRQQASDVDRLVNENNKLTIEASKYRDSTSYLQISIMNLQKTLEETRASQCEYKRLYDKEKEKFERVKQEINDVKLVANETKATLQEEHAKLMKDFSRLRTEYAHLCKDLSSAHENISKFQSLELVAVENETEANTLREELTAMKTEVECLRNAIKDQEEVYDKLQAKHTELHKELLDETKKKQYHITTLQEFKRESLEQQKCLLESNEVISQKSERVKELEALYQSAEKKSISLKDEIRELKGQIDKLHVEAETTKIMLKSTEESHKDMSARVLKAVHGLIDEKLARQNADANSKHMTKKVIHLEAESTGLRQKIHVLSENGKKMEEELKAKQAIEEKLQEATRNYHEVQVQYDEIIKELAATEIKCKEYKNKLDSYTTKPNIDQDFEERIYELKKSLEDSHAKVMSLQSEVASSHQQVATLKFEKSEILMKLHEETKRREVEMFVKNDLDQKLGYIMETLFRLKTRTDVRERDYEMLVDIFRTGNRPDYCFGDESNMTT